MRRLRRGGTGALGTLSIRGNSVNGRFGGGHLQQGWEGWGIRTYPPCLYTVGIPIVAGLDSDRSGTKVNPLAYEVSESNKLALYRVILFKRLARMLRGRVLGRDGPLSQTSSRQVQIPPQSQWRARRAPGCFSLRHRLHVPIYKSKPCVTVRVPEENGRKA